MRIGCLQFAPQVGDVDNNLNRADAVLNRADPQDLDLLVLPELAFTGYNFKSLEQISPFLEPCGSGISALWARTTALKYNCHVAVGYPEKVDPTAAWPTSPEYYNSLIVVNEDGETVANYRKTHLYYTDETWALEGDEGFFEGYIEGLGDTSMGICMDLNPYKFEAPWNSFEFAFHVLECQSNLAIVSMAWMTREDGRLFSRMPNEPDMDTLTYWATRLEPLIRVEGEREVIVVFCNRTGMEDDVVYAGTSTVVGILDGEVRVYGVLGRGEKELLVVDTDNPPYAKLVQRPADGVSVARGELQTSEVSVTPQSARATHSKRHSRDLGNAGGAGFGASQTSPTDTVAMSIGETATLHTRRNRPQPQLQIPTSRQTNEANSATSGKSMGSDIPTPSAPSPTPNGLRPKLVIPQSPEAVLRQGLSPMPMSAQSTYSVKSNASTKSRPPEDSTPYPHSGVPPSGHPRSRVIYEGHVSITQKAFSPITPFEDGSPVAYRNYRGHDNVNDAASDTSSQVSRTTASTARPPRRAFQDWPILQPRHVESREKTPVSQKAAARQPADASTAHAQSHKVPESRPSTVRPKEEPEGKETSRPPGRPSSPKSRNASRTGNRERSDSSLAQREDSAEFEQLLGSMHKRTESTSRTRGKGDQGSFPSRPVSRKGQDRPESRRGQDRSLSRPVRAETPIVISATAKVIGQDLTRPSTGGLPGQTQSSRRTTSRNGVHGRSASISEDSRARPGTHTPIRHFADSEQSTSRAVSRGRRPGPHAPTASHIEIGIGPDALGNSKEKHGSTTRHAQVDLLSGSPGPRNLSHESTRHGSGAGTPSRQASRAAQHDEEVTFCPHCSHEIRAPSKTPSRPSNSALGDYQPSPRQVLAATQSALGLINQMNGRSTSLDSRTSDSFANSEVDSFGTRGTASAVEISPSTPDYTDLKTPKAMIFFHDTDEAVVEGKPRAPSPDEVVMPSTYLKEIIL